MSKIDYDFAGYATRNDIICGDNNILNYEAFKSQHNTEVPLLLNNDHKMFPLGKCLLKNRKKGVYIYAKFNKTKYAQEIKKLVDDKELKELSIYANRLIRDDSNFNSIKYGVIREVSLVYKSLCPGALIDKINI